MEYYYFPRSHWSRVISLVLAEKGLAPTRHRVDISTNANYDPDYLRINPKGVVPTLVDGGVAVCNAPRIAAYLDDRADPRLVLDTEHAHRWTNALVELPLMLFSYSVWVLGLRGERSAQILDDKVERAGRYAERYPELRALYLRKQAFFEDFRAQVLDDEHVAVQKERTRALLDELGSEVASGQWICGDRYSFADCLATSILYRLVDLGILDHWHGDDHHGLHAYYGRLRGRPSFAAVFEDDPALAQ